MDLVAENQMYRLRIFQSEYDSRKDQDNIGTMVCAHRRLNLGDEKAMNMEQYDSWNEWLENEVLALNGGKENVVCLPLYLLDHGGLHMNTTGFGCPWDSGMVGWIYSTKEKFRKETGYSEDELFSTDTRRVPQIGEHVRVKGREVWGIVSAHLKEMLRVDFVDSGCDKVLSCRKSEIKIVTINIDQVEEVMSDRAREMLKDEVEEYDHCLGGRVYGFILEEKITCKYCGQTRHEQVDQCGGFVGSVDRISEHLDAETLPLLEELKKAV